MRNSGQKITTNVLAAIVSRPLICLYMRFLEHLTRQSKIVFLKNSIILAFKRPSSNSSWDDWTWFTIPGVESVTLLKAQKQIVLGICSLGILLGACILLPTRIGLVTGSLFKLRTSNQSWPKHLRYLHCIPSGSVCVLAYMYSTKYLMDRHSHNHCFQKSDKCNFIDSKSVSLFLLLDVGFGIISSNDKSIS